MEDHYQRIGGFVIQHDASLQKRPAACEVIILRNDWLEWIRATEQARIDMTRVFTILSILGFAITAAMTCVVISYSLNLAHHGSEFTNTATGQVVAIRNKTQTLYVTRPEIDKLYALMVINAGITLISTILLLLGRRKA